MVTPPDFGGRDFEEGIEEDVGVPSEELPVHSHLNENAPGDEDYDDNEDHATGQMCARCGTVITAGQEARRRSDGHWVHETCPTPGA